MKLVRTLKTLRQILGVSDTTVEPIEAIDDALLVNSIGLVLRILKMEIKSLADEELEPTLLLELSKFYQSIGDEPSALAAFQRAAAFVDQNRGYYSDIGYCSQVLRRESASEEFRLEVENAVQRLLKICPFSEDLERALI